MLSNKRMKLTRAVGAGARRERRPVTRPVVIESGARGARPRSLSAVFGGSRGWGSGSGQDRSGDGEINLLANGPLPTVGAATFDEAGPWPFNLPPMASTFSGSRGPERGACVAALTSRRARHSSERAWPRASVPARRILDAAGMEAIGGFRRTGRLRHHVAAPVATGQEPAG